MSEPTTLLKKLTETSIRRDYNPHGIFDWPESIPDTEWVMSPELMSVFDTPQSRELDERTLKALSRWESVNFYSMTLHGERDLVDIINDRLYRPGFEDSWGFFHRFIGEENDHMWFLSEFCRRYGKIYPDRRIGGPLPGLRSELTILLDFLHILIFEEMGVRFNLRMAEDERLPAIVRKINQVHHHDESRHIAGGRELVRKLWDGLQPTLTLDERSNIREDLRTFIGFTLLQLYHPEIYRDAGIADHYRFRRELLAQPERRKHHGLLLAHTLAFLFRLGIVEDPEGMY